MKHLRNGSESPLIPKGGWVVHLKEKSKDGEETYKRFHELIFLVDKPQYISTNEGDAVIY